MYSFPGSYAATGIAKREATFFLADCRIGSVRLADASLPYFFLFPHFPLPRFQRPPSPLERASVVAFVDEC